MNLFLLQLYGELHKMFARKRTYIGFGAFLLLEILVLFFLQLPKVQRAFRHLIEDQSGYLFEDYFSGVTLAFIILSSSIFILGALYLALVAGDVVSKEVEDGTMRMILCRPVSRARVIAIKALSSAIYTFVLLIFIGVTALLTGAAYRGFGGLFVFVPEEGLVAFHQLAPGIARYLCALPLVALSLMSITALAFMFSCFNMKPAAATILTLSYFFLDWIFRHIPYFESIKFYFLTTHMSAWLRIFEAHIPWTRMIEDYAFLLAIDATFLIAGWFYFEQRDFKA